MGTREEQLEKEIQEIEKIAFGTEDTDKDEGAAEAQDSKAVDETTQKTEEANGTSESHVPDTESKKETEERDWSLDYKKLRANSDQYKYQTRQELAALKEQVASLEKDRVQNLPQRDTFKDTFTKEEEDLLGAKALDAIKKASKTASDETRKDLQVQLDYERKLRLEAEHRATKQVQAQKGMTFLSKLEGQVPDYKAINLDPNFEKFIYDNDPINGGQRLTYFRNAEDRGDVATVAKYMLDFQASSAKPDLLAQKVTPSGQPVSNVDPGDKQRELLPVSEMDKFYDDVGKGKYKGKASLQKKHQEKWDRAFEDGFIDFRR